jgi:hypothetical protein
LDGFFIAVRKVFFANGGYMKNLKVALVVDWREGWKWAELQLLAALALLYSFVPHLLPLLAEHWPELAPWVMHFFPRTDASVVPVISFVLVALARLTELKRGGDR